ncbi:MAG: VCBS repeat-containing protein [Phaeodactylibacter sp.]|nr:VCBS repeat-containing protein [Phaeodactylibacter sp.]
MYLKKLSAIGFALCLFQCAAPEQKDGEKAPAEFTMIAYQNPGMAVDLGVGLWAWPLPMDFDGDGDMDLIVACPDTPYNGTYFFENKSSEEGGMPVFEPAVRLGPGHKNLQVSFVDGQPRVLGPGVEYLNFRDSIFANPVELFPSEQLEKNHQKIRFSQWKFVDYENDGDLDLIAGIDDWGDYGWDNAFDENGNWTNGPLHGYLYLVENNEGVYQAKGKIEAGGAPIDVYGAPSPNMNDFDGDGDLDIICGEFLDRFTWFENIGTRESPIFAEGRFLENEDGVLKMGLEMITPVAMDWDGDGDVDLAVGDEDGRVALVENTGTLKDGMPVFNTPVYFSQKASHVKFGALATPYSVDWDGDGDEDLISGNTAGYIGFIENLDGGNPPKWDKPELLTANGEVIRIMAGDSGSIQGPAEKKWGYTTLSVADWDGDGLKDIIINSIWGKVEWFENIGSKGAPALAPAQPVQVAWGNADIPKPEWNWWDPAPGELATQWRTTPNAIDWNKDGLMDLVMLDYEGYLAFFERFKDGETLRLKPGQRIFYGTNGSEFDRKNEVVNEQPGPLRLNNGKYGKSGRRKWCFADWDQDGDLDILLNSMNVALLENTGEEGGQVQFAFRGNLSEQKLAGHTTSPTTVDWDNDGVPSLLLGAEDGFFYYLPNSNGN